MLIILTTVRHLCSPNRKETLPRTQEESDKQEEMERQRYDFSYHMVDELTWMGLRAQLHKWGGGGTSQVSRAVRERAAPLSFSLSPSSLLGKRDTSHPPIVSKNTLEKRKEETSIEGGSRKKPFWTRPFPLVKIMPTGRNCKTGT